MRLLTAGIAVVSLTLASGCGKKSSGSDTAASASAAPTAAPTAAAPASNLPVKGPWEAIKITMTKKDPDGTAHFHIDNLGSKTVSSIFLDTYGYDAKGKQLAHKELSFSIPTKGGASNDFTQDPVKDVDAWEAVYHGLWFDGDASATMDYKRAPAQRAKGAR
jgi:hypothetical protein